MKTSPSERKKKNEKAQIERITLFNKANHLDSNGASVYVIVEYNGRYFVYNGRSDQEWPLLDARLVSDVIVSHSV